jgi:pimeloyl-ACP methyl ester carboxylesterase
MVGILPAVSPLLVSLLGHWLRSPTRGVLTQLAQANPRFLRWAAGAILSWHPSPEAQHVRVFQIHGDRDKVFPIHLVEADRVVKGAGHLISITHAQEVIDFLQQSMENIRQETTPGPPDP